jgi:hypothetical protein
MDCDSNGGPGGAPGGERLNIFALVIYIPDPLGAYLDDLRKDLVPDCQPHAHVSVLPPRPLAVGWRTASAQARSLIECWKPFDIELTGIRVFPVTDVVYIEVGAGEAELRRMHAAVGQGALAFHEPFPYHPHITLAQDIPHEDVPAATERASRHWSEYRGPRVFRADRAVLVQNTLGDQWIDLAEYPIGAVAVR